MVLSCVFLGSSNVHCHQADCQERKMKEKMEFLQGFPATSRLSETTLSTIITNFSTHTLQRNQVIFKEGDPAENLYFVQQGEVVVNNTD